MSAFPSPARIAALALAGALAGCASTRTIDSDVASFGAWPPGRAAGSFAFERLPSQQARPDQQDRLEAAALPALERAGFRTAASPGGQPDALVQVAARTLNVDGGWNAVPLWPNGALYRGGRWRGGAPGFYGSPWASSYRLSEVSLLIRDARTQQVLYETRVQSDGAWLDDAVRAALFDAALKDFPRPAISPRRVTVDVPR